MRHLIIKFFVGDTSLAVTADDMTRLEVKCRNMFTELKPDISAFQMERARAECTEVESCNAYLTEKRDQDMENFEEEFSRFSIFCSKNPMVRMVWQV